MKKAISLLLTLCCIAFVKAQYKITCGSQTFNITAKEISTVMQVDASTKTKTTSTYYYSISNNKLQVWLQTGDLETRSFTFYEIEKQPLTKKYPQK
jgi:hypothetical protein